MAESFNSENYLHYVELPLKLVACWEWFPKPSTKKLTMINNLYLSLVLFMLTKSAVGLSVHLYTDWVDIMSCLDEIADYLPLIVSVIIVSYYTVYRDELYDLHAFMRRNFKHHSAQGLTNTNMKRSYETAKKFAKIYTACTMFSVTMYSTLPVLVHWWTKEPIQGWIYASVTLKPHFVFIFLQSLITQWFVGLSMGQFGVFFAANSILICGQLELLCCSLQNLRYTALLQHGVLHSAIASAHGDIEKDEMYGYSYNQAEMVEPKYHYDKKTKNNFIEKKSQFDIYSREYDDATMAALRDCSVMCQAVMEYKDRFERFVSPLLALRVIQVTLYLCTLLYAATLKFDMVTVEYLAAVALDIFVYCYYGNQIIQQVGNLIFTLNSFLVMDIIFRPSLKTSAVTLPHMVAAFQADRVSTAAYQSSWHTLDVRPRKALLNLLLANRRPVVMRAGRFLPMDLHTFVVIIKTSFSYYTLLVNVNEK